MNRAMDIAKETLLASLPTDAPPMFQSIDRARFEGKHQIVAHVTMFDGLPAVARFKAWAFGWSIGWDVLQGGAASLEQGSWRRVEP